MAFCSEADIQDYNDKKGLYDDSEEQQIILCEREICNQISGETMLITDTTKLPETILHKKKTSTLKLQKLASELLSNFHSLVSKECTNHINGKGCYCKINVPKMFIFKQIDNINNKIYHFKNNILIIFNSYECFKSKHSIILLFKAKDDSDSMWYFSKCYMTDHYWTFKYISLLNKQLVIIEEFDDDSYDCDDPYIPPHYLIIDLNLNFIKKESIKGILKNIHRDFNNIYIESEYEYDSCEKNPHYHPSDESDREPEYIDETITEKIIYSISLSSTAVREIFGEGGNIEGANNKLNISEKHEIIDY